MFQTTQAIEATANTKMNRPSDAKLPPKSPFIKPGIITAAMIPPMTATTSAGLMSTRKARKRDRRVAVTMSAGAVN